MPLLLGLTVDSAFNGGQRWNMQCEFHSCPPQGQKGAPMLWDLGSYRPCTAYILYVTICLPLMLDSTNLAKTFFCPRLFPFL